MALHRVVPNFRLIDAHGRPISLWDYRHRQPVVLVLGDEGLLRSFARHYPEYRALGAEVLAIVSGAVPGRFPFPVLLDTAGQVADRLTDGQPAVLVLDRYGELYARFTGPWEDGPDQRDVLEWVAFTELECPE